MEEAGEAGSVGGEDEGGGEEEDVDGGLGGGEGGGGGVKKHWGWSMRLLVGRVSFYFGRKEGAARAPVGSQLQQCGSGTAHQQLRDGTFDTHGDDEEKIR